MSYIQVLKLLERALAYPLVGIAVAVATIQLRYLVHLNRTTTEQAVRLGVG